MSVLAPAENASPADWLVERLTTFAESVTSLVPSGFEAYVRIFHPAHRERERVRWAQLAAARGSVAHPGMQLGALLGGLQYQGPGPRDAYDHEPEIGRLPRELVPPLATTLARHTETDRCWFAVWEGYGRLPQLIRDAPAFALPNRRYHLLYGQLDAAESVLGDPWAPTVNLWWPDDRGWCVASEIDLNTSYVGCSSACSAELLGDDEIEALEIDPATGITWDSDALNPRPVGP
ncbi:MAG: hypothetical protein ACRDLK_00155 [Gaiellaceae bacterium]